MVHISDIARITGVSNATMSHVINGTAKMSGEKTKRVEEAIRKIGFNSDEIARSLYKKSSRLTGYIVPGILNIFLSEVRRAIEDEVFRSSCKMILCDSGENPEKEASYIKMLMGMNTDGIVITTNNEYLEEETRSYPIPIVLIGKSADVSYATSVQLDNYTDTRITTEHLVDCGYRKLVLMRGPIRYSSSRQHCQGYVDVCREHQIEPLFVNDRYSYGEGVQSTRGLFERYPDTDGVLASADLMAFALYKMLYEQHRKTPDGAVIADCDDVGLSRLIIPTLTTVAQPIEEVGRLYVQLVIEQAEHGTIQRRGNMLPVSLKIRKATKRKEGV